MSRTSTKGSRITVDLGDQELYRAVKILAAYQGKPVRDLVIEAIREWLKRQEAAEDLRDCLAVESEAARPLEDFLAGLKR